ncbi:MAG: hypothetical protein A2176_01450 [Spirochaetes bacterium RBG_13_51_14]|nr:MAG: hypothetical protein A2176_01450 [Spirochaetes bacterium RBG_13_51_14]
MNPSDTKLSDMTFCALDLETTGTNPALHEIVEVGIIRFSMNGIKDVYDTLVNPGITIPSETVGVHGITDEMVQGAPQIEDILFRIDEFIRDSLLVIHCPEFDLSFLGLAFRKNDMPVPEMTAVDTVRLSRRAYPRLTNCKLETICSHLRLEIMHHRAYPDARGCMEIFTDIIRSEDPHGVWTVSHLRNYHGAFVRLSGAKQVHRINKAGKKLKGIMLGKTVDITYIDQSGNVTKRKIHPREFITVGGETYLLAHCHLRGDTRYFKMDRIMEIN